MVVGLLDVDSQDANVRRPGYETDMPHGNPGVRKLE
jgi:hypothetical protein